MPIRAHQLALGGESVSFEHVWEGRTFQTRVEPLRGEQGEITGCIGIAVDITERKHAEEALYREKERAQVTLASIGDGVVRADAERRIDYLNPVAERLTGWTAEEAIGRTVPEVFQVVDEITRQPLADPVARCLEEGRVVESPGHARAGQPRRQGVLGARLGGADLRPLRAPRSAPSWCSRTSPSSAAWSARWSTSRATTR